MKNKPLVLVLDYDVSPGPGVLCALTQTRRYLVVGVTTKPSHKSSFSLRHRVVYAPELDCDCSNVDLFVREFKAKFNGAILLPSTSRTVKWLIRNQKELSKHWKIPHLPHLKAFTVAANKAEFAQFALDNDIPTPVTRTLEEFLQEGGQGIVYPILIKPTQFNAGEGVRRFEDFNSLQTWVSKRKVEGQYIVQNWLGALN